VKRKLPEGEELGVEWERWADGRAWRLKRGRDFGDVHPELARRAAKNAARRMGKVVQTVRDRIDGERYTWVQFADYEIPLGAPCPCGGRRLYRLHTYFARCAACGAQLLLTRASVSAGGEEAEDEAAAGLRDLSEVHLERVERTGDREIYRGYGRSGEAPVLVIAEFHAEEGEPLLAEEAADRLASLQVVPFTRLGPLVDVSSLWSRAESEWDLVL